jgi:hypothetical protein
VKIDPTQPIYFDTDIKAGTGRGFWQLNPPPEFDWSETSEGDYASAAEKTWVGRFVQRLFFAVVLGVIATGALDMVIR